MTSIHDPTKKCTELPSNVAIDVFRATTLELLHVNVHDPIRRNIHGPCYDHGYHGHHGYALHCGYHDYEHHGYGSRYGHHGYGHHDYGHHALHGCHENDPWPLHDYAQTLHDHGPSMPPHAAWTAQSHDLGLTHAASSGPPQRHRWPPSQKRLALAGNGPVVVDGTLIAVSGQGPEKMNGRVETEETAIWNGLLILLKGASFLFWVCFKLHAYGQFSIKN